MPTPALAQSAYDGLPELLRREVDARRRTMSRMAILARGTGSAEENAARERIPTDALVALERIPEDIRAEPRPFGAECVQLVVTALALALGAADVTI